MRILFLILLLLFNLKLMAHPYEADGMLVNPFHLILSYNKSESYKMQFNINVKPINGKGFYKNIFAEGLSFKYGLRLHNENTTEHKFKFILLNYLTFPSKIYTTEQ